MNKVTLWISIHANDWIAESAIITTRLRSTREGNVSTLSIRRGDTLLTSPWSLVSDPLWGWEQGVPQSLVQVPFEGRERIPQSRLAQVYPLARTRIGVPLPQPGPGQEHPLTDMTQAVCFLRSCRRTVLFLVVNSLQQIRQKLTIIILFLKWHVLVESSYIYHNDRRFNNNDPLP